eukprot:Rmarinus@m.8048
MKLTQPPCARTVIPVVDEERTKKKGGNLREDMDSKRAKKKKKDKRRPRSGSEDSEDDYHPPSADPDEEVLPVTDGDEPEEEPPTPEEDSSDTGTDRSEADSTSVPAVTETIAPGKSIEGDGENVASGGAPEQDFRVPGVMLRERRKRSVQRSNRQTTTRALYNNPQHESMEAEVAVIIVVALVIVAVLTMLLTSGTPPPLLPATKLTPSVVNSRPAPQLLRPPVEMPHTSAHANNGKHKMGQGTATPVTIAGQTPVPLGQIKR